MYALDHLDNKYQQEQDKHMYIHTECMLNVHHVCMYIHNILCIT